MPYPHIDRLSYMLGYSVSLADEITRWMDSVANSLTDVANCITHARNSLNMTGKTGDAIEVNLDSLGKAILQHTDNISTLTSARRTVTEGARTAVSHANEIKNQLITTTTKDNYHLGANSTYNGQSSPASGSTSDSSTGPDPAQAAKMQALDAKAAKYLAQLSATTDAGIVKLAEIYPPDHSNSRGRGGGGHHAHSGTPESSGAPSGTVVPASVSPQHSAAVWQRGPDVMGPVGTPGASHPIGDHSPGGAGVSGPGVRLESAQPPATGHGLTGHGGHGSPLLSPDVTDAQLGERASLGFRNQTAKPSGWTSPVVSASTLAVAGALARGANLAQARASLRQAAQAAQTTAARAGTNPVARAGAPAGRPVTPRAGLPGGRATSATGARAASPAQRPAPTSSRANKAVGTPGRQTPRTGVPRAGAPATGTRTSGAKNETARKTAATKARTPGVSRPGTAESKTPTARTGMPRPGAPATSRAATAGGTKTGVPRAGTPNGARTGAASGRNPGKATERTPGAAAGKTAKTPANRIPGGAPRTAEGTAAKPGTPTGKETAATVNGRVAETAGKGTGGGTARQAGRQAERGGASGIARRQVETGSAIPTTKGAAARTAATRPVTADPAPEPAVAPRSGGAATGAAQTRLPSQSAPSVVRTGGGASGIAHAAPVQQPRTEPGIRIVAGVSAPRDRIPAAGRPATTAGVTAPRQRVDATVAGAPGNNREGTKEIPE